MQVLAFAGATGGYLWGFLLASALVGWLSRQGWDRSIRSSISAMLLGSIAIYAVGVPWLHHALPAILGEPVSWQTTFELGLYPFLIGDTVKLLLAAGLLPLAWRALQRAASGRRGGASHGALVPRLHDRRASAAEALVHVAVRGPRAHPGGMARRSWRPRTSPTSTRSRRRSPSSGGGGGRGSSRRPSCSASRSSAAR